ncbi:MAG: NAD kinase [Bacteroidetes bacterium]|nr:NAD kinase [Bacteroidota bacterium]
MKAVVYSQILNDSDIPHVQNLFNALNEEDIQAFVYTPYLKQLKAKIGFKKRVGHFDGYADFSKKEIDFVITLGGDGTILRATTLVRDSNVPIMGINLGRLGFLASIEKKRINEAVRLLRQGMYSFEKRTLLYLESNYPIFGETSFALNDFAIQKRDTSSMITIHTFIDGNFLNSYWADGLIVATPTGSTGYSLSCGGPIIFPNSGNFVITPVAPHNLNVRPIVISDDSEVTFEIEGRGESFLCTLDSRYERIDAQHKLALRKCDFFIRMVQLQDIDFMQTMRNKLSWGVDSRNH